MDFFSLLCAVVVLCTLYRAIPLISNLYLKRNMYYRRKVCIQQFAEIFVDMWYFVKFAIVTVCLRHAISLPMDLATLLSHNASVIPLRQCIDGYIVWVLDDVLHVLSYLFRYRTYRYLFVTAIWGIFIPAMSMAPLLRTQRKAIVITFAVCFVTLYYGWPLIIAFHHTSAPWILHAFFLVLCVINAIAVVINVATSKEPMAVTAAAGGVGATASSLDDFDVSYAAYGGVSQFVSLSWSNTFTVLGMLLEVVQVVALACVNGGSLPGTSAFYKAAQYLLLEMPTEPSSTMSVGLYFSLVAAAFVYFLGSLPIVVVGVMEERNTFEATPWKAWALATQFFSGMCQIVVIRHLVQYTLCLTSDQVDSCHPMFPWVVVALLALAAYVPLTLTRGHRFTLGAAHHLELHFADLYTHVRTALLQVCVGVCAVYGGRPSVVLPALTLYSFIMAVFTLGYNRFFQSPHALCPVAFVAATQQSLHVLQFGICCALWAVGEQVPDITFGPIVGILAALCATGLLLYALSLRRSPIAFSLQTTVDELREKLLHLESFLTSSQKSALSAKWSLRRRRWLAQVNSADKADMIALLLLKLEKHIGVEQEGDVFFLAREGWIKSVTSLISPAQRLRYSKVPCDRNDSFIYCRLIPYERRHFLTAWAVPYSFLPEGDALEKVQLSLQSLINATGADMMVINPLLCSSPAHSMMMDGDDKRMDERFITFE